MVYCLMAEIAFSSQARLDEVLADLENATKNKRIYSLSYSAAVLRQGPFGLKLSARFEAKQDEQALADRLETFLTGARAPEPGSWYSLHDCRHDEAAQHLNITPCEVETLRSY